MSRGRRKGEEQPSQREKEVEFEQDRATQNYPVTLLCRNTTEGGGEPFAERAEEGGRGDSRRRWRRRPKNFFIRPRPLTTRFFTKKTFFLLPLQEVALEAPAPLLYKAVWSLLLLFSDVLPRLLYSAVPFSIGGGRQKSSGGAAAAAAAAAGLKLFFSSPPLASFLRLGNGEDFAGERKERP